MNQFRNIGVVFFLSYFLSNAPEYNFRRLCTFSDQSAFFLSYTLILGDKYFYPTAVATSLSVSLGNYFLLGNKYPITISDFTIHFFNSIVALYILFNKSLSFKSLYHPRSFEIFLKFMIFHTIGQLFYNKITKKWIYPQVGELDTDKGKRTYIKIILMNMIFYNLIIKKPILFIKN
tara:strand:+ start:904 stop:1431 length:528 start_codon:yes stop_codon:yes gene_type:complete